MDALAGRGTAFTQAHIPSGTSGAVCMPSRAMLNTGRTLFHLEDEGQNIPEEHVMLGEALRGAGYRSFGCGKWHNGPPAFSRAFDSGDNIFFGGMWDHWNVPTCRYDPTGGYDNEINFTANFFSNNGITRVHCDAFNPGVHSTELLTGTAIAALKDMSRGADPFFLYTAYLAPHDPRTMPERFRSMYDPAAIELPANFTENPINFGIREIRDEVLAAYPRNPDEIRRHIAEYYAMITHLDHELGRLMAALLRCGRAEDTIVVLAGDNGLAVGQHGLMGKQNHFEHSVRVPLVMAGPGIPAGAKIDNYVYLLDIYPTLMELTGLSAPGSVEGISFAPMLKNPGHVTRPALYFMYTDMIRSVKDGRYKLIEYRGDRRFYQLFDLLADPHETNDLSGSPAHREEVSKLLTLREQFRGEWEDTDHPLTRSFWGMTPLTRLAPENLFRARMDGRHGRPCT